VLIAAGGISTGQIAIIVSIVGCIVGVLAFLNQRRATSDANKISEDAVQAEKDANNVAERQANWNELNDTIDNLRENLRQATDESARLREGQNALRTELDQATTDQEGLRRSLQAAQANITILQQYIERHVSADAPPPPKLWKVEHGR